MSFGPPFRNGTIGAYGPTIFALSCKRASVRFRDLHETQTIEFLELLMTVMPFLRILRMVVLSEGHLDVS